MDPFPRSILAAAVLCCAVALPANAQPFLRVDRCNLVLVNGQPYDHYSFTVLNTQANRSLGTITFIPTPNQAPGDTCHTLARVGPQDWTDQGNGFGGGGFGWACGTFSGGTLLGVIPPGGSQSGFELTLSRPTCCFDVILGDPVVIGDEWGGTVCLACEGATAGRPGTWGAIKSLYR